MDESMKKARKSNCCFQPVDVFASYIVELISVSQIHSVFVIERSVLLLSVHDTQGHQDVFQGKLLLIHLRVEKYVSAASTNSVPLSRCAGSRHTATGAAVLLTDNKIRRGREMRGVNSCTSCLPGVCRGFMLLS